MNIKNLEDIQNPRLCKFKDKTLRFSFETLHIPGKHLSIEDSVSRYQVSAAEEENETLEETLSNMQYRRVAEDKFRTCSWDQVKKAAVLDDVCVRLNDTIRFGFPEHVSEMQSDLKFAWNKRQGL